MSAADQPTLGGELTSDVEQANVLCEQMARGIKANTGSRPRMTATWREPMTMLLRYGRTDGDPSKPKVRVTADEVQALLEGVFTHLVRPGNDGFCWARFIEPRSLRNNWGRIEQQLKEYAAAASSGPELFEPTPYEPDPEEVQADVMAQMRELRDSLKRPPVLDDSGES